MSYNFCQYVCSCRYAHIMLMYIICIYKLLWSLLSPFHASSLFLCNLFFYNNLWWTFYAVSTFIPVVTYLYFSILREIYILLIKCSDEVMKWGTGFLKYLKLIEEFEKEKEKLVATCGKKFRWRVHNLVLIKIFLK